MLRDYQQDAVDRLWEYWAKGNTKPCILQLSTGCFVGDTMVRINSAANGHQISIRQLYQSWNKVKQDGKTPRAIRDKNRVFVRGWRDGAVGLNKVKDVVCMGKKPIVRLEFSDGTIIRCTPDHPFLAKTNACYKGEPEWVEAKDLLGMVVAKDNPHTQRLKGESKIRDRYMAVPMDYPYGSRHYDRRNGRHFKTVELHRAIYEANLNGFRDVYDWKDAIGKIPLKAIDPKKYHIHHIDHNHYNNDPSNLEAVEKETHLRHHSNPQNFHQGLVEYIKCIEVEECGEETVYDIKCEGVHSYTANDFVVHNSGKSHIIAEIVRRLKAPVLVLQPSKEILEQNYEKLILAGVPESDIYICSASANSWMIGKITLATIGTIGKHAKLCQQFGVVVVDECDVVNNDLADGQYLKFFNALPDKLPIVGLTATPLAQPELPRQEPPACGLLPSANSNFHEGWQGYPARSVVLDWGDYLQMRDSISPAARLPCPN